MNYEDLYDYMFNKLFEEAKARIAGVERWHNSPNYYRLKPLFRLGEAGIEEDAHHTVQDLFKTSVPRYMGDLLLLMLARKYSNDESMQVLPLYGALEAPNYGHYPMPHFVIRSKAGTNGFICSNRYKRDRELARIAQYEELKRMQGIMKHAIEIGEFRREAGLAQILDYDLFPQLDSITCIVLADEDGHFIEDSRTANKPKELSIQVHNMPFRDFFAQYFGDIELVNFTRRLESFDRLIWEETAVDTIGIPTKKRLEMLKSEFLRDVTEEVCGYKFELKKHGIDESQYEIIRDHFFDDDVYLSLIGGADFADSLISSEWMMGIHRLTETLDQTGAVAGYLKSVEQLLYLMVRQWKGKDKIIPKFYSKSSGTYTDTENYPDSYSEDNILNLTGWSLACFFDPKLNKGVLHISDAAGSALVTMLRSFMSDERNVYFHKRNLHCSYRSSGTSTSTSNYEVPNELERIRHDALLLLFLILGSCVMDDECRKSLKIPYKHPRIVSSSDRFGDCLLDWVKGEFDNPIFKYRVNAGAEFVVFSFGSDLNKENNDDILFSKREGSYWQMSLGVFENEADLRNNQRIPNGGIYESKQCFNWAQTIFRNQMLEIVADQMSCYNWEDLFSWSVHNPKVVLRDPFNDEFVISG